MSYSVQMFDGDHDQNKGWRQLSVGHEKKRDATRTLDQFAKKFRHRSLRVVNDQTGRGVVTHMIKHVELKSGHLK